VEAFGILVGRYQDRIYSVAHNYVSNPDDAVDIAQETFVKAYSKLRSFDASSAFYTWLYRIAINSAIDFLRRRKSRPADSLDDDRFTTVGFEPVSVDPRSDPERVAVRHEQTAALRGAIGTLSQKLRTALVLHDVEGLSQEEVAQMLSIPVGTVKSRVSRARTELRHRLSGQLGDTL
jgi:RNA polymerase sigma-70 factor (ECF subfamily)